MRFCGIRAEFLCSVMFAGVLMSGPSVSAQENWSITPKASPYIGSDARPVDLAIVLDASGSMTKLLDQVRFQLWEAVNELAAMHPTPALRVGLVTFGSREGTRNNGWIVKHTDLSTTSERRRPPPDCESAPASSERNTKPASESYRTTWTRSGFPDPKPRRHGTTPWSPRKCEIIFARVLRAWSSWNPSYRPLF